MSRKKDAMRDIVVCGFPKSGNTWLSRLLAEVIQCPVAGYFGLPEAKEQAEEGKDRISEYRLWKAHRRARIVLEDQVSIKNVIFIVRDIRDIVVSSFHYWDDLDMKAAYQRTKCGHVHASPWNIYIKDWVAQNPYTVRYEDLLANTEAEVKKMLLSLGIEEPKNILACLERQSFGVRKQEFESTRDPRLRLFYKGKSGLHKEEIEDDLLELITSENRNELMMLGYPVIPEPRTI
jgi:hypothetical protein